MNILLITDELPPHILGGSGRIAWETAVGLARLGHEVTILTAAPAGTFPAEKDGVRLRTIEPLPPRWAHYRSVFSRTRERVLLNIINDIRPDIIHAHGLAWQMGYRWIAPARAEGIVCIHTFHGVMAVAYGKMFGDESWPLLQDLRRARWTWNPLRNVVVRRSLLSCNALLCVSDALRTYLEGRGYAGRFQTLHNGIDMTFWAAGPSREEARRTLDLPPDRRIFLLVGRLGHDKGLSVAIETLPKDALLLLAGEGDPENWAILGNRACFLPKKDSEGMRLLYAAADVTLVPSLYLDPFPTVCLEAMACATPVIATIHGGAKEAMRDGVTGWLTDPRHAVDLTARLSWCMEHPDELRSAGEAARIHVQQHFSLETHVRKLMEVYDQSLR